MQLDLGLPESIQEDPKNEWSDAYSMVPLASYTVVSRPAEGSRSIRVRFRRQLSARLLPGIVPAEREWFSVERQC